MRKPFLCCLTIAIACCLLGPIRSTFAQKINIEEFLSEGRLATGEQMLSKYLKSNPRDDQARFGLGIIQFFQAVEHLGNSIHKYGVRDGSGMLFLRLPVPESKNPEPITLQQFRDIFQTMVDDLDEASNTLGKITDKDVTLTLALFKTRIDLDGNGKISERESMASIISPMMGNIGQQLNMEELKIKFDRADVHWLKGYCHLLRAICEFGLAHDFSESWHVMARFVFPKAEVKFDFIKEENPDIRGFSFGPIADLIAGFHNMRMPVTSPEKMKNARRHLLAMIAESRKMWDFSMDETDNDAEWIPNPKQTSALTNTRVTDRMVTTWKTFLDEAEAILNGELLVPFWRGKNPKRGVNFKKFFEEPTDFDFILWLQGSAAIPYLEEGECSSAETWSEFQRVFRGDFIGFAVWFN